MLPSKSNHQNRAAVTIALAAAGLGLGGTLGYVFQSPPAALVPVTTVQAPAASATAPSAKTEVKTPPPPYDMETLVKGSSRNLSEFAAWLQTASYDEVARLLVDPAVNVYPGNPPANALLVRRFGEFSVDERFFSLKRHLGEKGQIRQYELLQVFSDLARDTLPNRADEMLALFKKGSQIDDYSLATVMKDWAAADISAALAFAGQLGNQGERLTGLILSGLAEKDSVMATQQALKLPAGRSRDEAMRGIASSMAKKDLGAALDWLNQSDAGEQSNDPFKSNPVTGAIGAAVNVNPAAAAQLLLDRPGLFENRQGPEQVSGLFKQWAEKDPAAATAWLAAHPLSETHQKAAESALAQASLAKLPVGEALSVWANLPADSDSLSALTTRLLSEDPAHAVERIAQVLPEKDRADAIGSLISNLAPENFSQAMPYLKELGAWLEKNSYQADRFAQFPPEELDELIKGLPEKAANLVRAATLENVLEGDPVQALNIVESSGREKLDPYNASRLAVILSETEPQKASEWVAGFPEGPGKEAATRNLVANWAKFDPAAAITWLQTLPPGPSRDHASLEAAKVQSLSGNPESAMTLAAGIQDSNDRSQATGYALQRLWRKDPVAAAASLTGSGLPAAAQSSLTKKLQTGVFLR